MEPGRAPRPPRGTQSTPPALLAASKRRDPVGLGRNCTLFETARHWAYREIRNHWGNPTGLGHAITAHAHQLNTEFAEPLPHNEVHHLAASITRWITTRSDMWNDGQAVYEANFTLIQHHRGTKGAVASAAARRAWHAQLLGAEDAR